MLLDAARDWGIDLSRSFIVGDRWRDVEAGRAAGCRTVLIEAGYEERRTVPDFSAQSLVDACEIILRVGASRRRSCGP
jgi:D-glycero-D-manno-heptose 1,7-bisphosphate phosphatase